MQPRKLRHLMLTGLALCLTGVSFAKQPDALEIRQKEDAAGKGDASYSLPEGTMGPITLKSTLQKTQLLSITLMQALQLATGQNITIAIEEENERQKKYEYYERLSDLLPDLTAEYRQSRFIGGAQIFGGEVIPFSRTTYQPQITANYTIYTAGQNIFEIRASKHRAEAQKSLLEEARQNVLTQVAFAYYDLQQAYWQRAIILQAIKEAELEVDLNRARFESGIGVKLDLLQAEAFLANRKQELIQAENQITKTSQRLIQLLNLDFEVDIAPASLESTTAKFVPRDMPYATLVTWAKVRHPQLKALERMLLATKNDIRAIAASVFPKIDITAYLNGTGPQIHELVNTRFAGIHISTNLLDNLGTRNFIRRKQAKSYTSEAELTIRQAERILEENIANSLAELKTQEEAIAVGKEALQYAQAAYSQAYGRLKEGVGTTVDLQNAMTTLTQARSNLANAFLAYNKAQVALLSSLGSVTIETLTQGFNLNGHNTPETP